MLGAIISLFTIFLYTALGTYVLTRNPHERTNKIFAILMLVFIIWSVGTYNIGIVSDNVSLDEAVLYTKIQLSGAIISLTILVFFALSLTKEERILKTPLAYLTAIPSIYLLYLIWSSDVAGFDIFSKLPGAKNEFFLFSTIFAIAGIYLLLKYYNASKYREHEQARLILAGAIAAILTAVTANIMLPMFFEIYTLQISTIAPAVMGIFFAYAVYRYGLFIRPMPEISVTSFCGTDCTLCPEFLDEHCKGCKLDKERYKNCEAYRCAIEKGYSGCVDCPEIITCVKRTSKQICFSSKQKYDLKPGAYLVQSDGYELFKDAVKHGAFGLVATTGHPDLIRAKYDLTTIVWISREAFDNGVRPDKLGRLSVTLINFMKRTGNAMILIDGINDLIKVNGLDGVQNFITILKNMAQNTNSRLIIPSDPKNEDIGNLDLGLNEFIP